MKLVRFLSALAILFSFAQFGAGAPMLTTVQDTIYKADGKLFSGTVYIEWKSFEAADSSNVLTQRLSVPIVNGILKVQLVPTTDAVPSATYRVRYNANGRMQSQETWAVPPSAIPVKLRDVRVTQAGELQASPLESPLLESDIAGLPGDLAIRPVKGAGYASSRTAVINEQGALDAATGDSSDCVRVDGTSGPCGPAYVDGETPGGPIDGINRTFLLAGSPEPLSSLLLFRNGLLQKRAVDYSIDSNVVTFAEGAVPGPTDVLVASYRTTPDVQAQSGSAFATAGVTASLGPVALPVSPAEKQQFAEAPSHGRAVAALSYSVPQVLCAGAGSTASTAERETLGECVIPFGFAKHGDRLDIRFDYSQDMGAGGMIIECIVNGTPIIVRHASARETAIAGRVEVMLGSSRADWSGLSWGKLMRPAADTGSFSRSSGDVRIEFSARLKGNKPSAVTLRNITVTRYPGVH